MTPTPRKPGRPPRVPKPEPALAIPKQDLHAAIQEQSDLLDQRPEPVQAVADTQEWLEGHFAEYVPPKTGAPGLDTDDPVSQAQFRKQAIDELNAYLDEPSEVKTAPAKLDLNEIERKARALAEKAAAIQEAERIEFLKARAAGKPAKPVRSYLGHDTESDPCAVFNSLGEPVGTPGWHVATVRCVDEEKGHQTSVLVDKYQARGYRPYRDPKTGNLIITPRGVVMECSPETMIRNRAAQLLERREESAAELNARRAAIEDANRGSGNSFATVEALPGRTVIRENVSGWDD